MDFTLNMKINNVFRLYLKPKSASERDNFVTVKRHFVLSLIGNIITGNIPI